MFSSLSKVRQHSGIFIQLLSVATLIIFPSCTEPVSLDSESGATKKAALVEIESSFEVSQDGQVRASGAIEAVTRTSLALAGVTFGVTERTTVSHSNGMSMTLSEVSVGRFFQVDGHLQDDGSYVASAVRADSMVVVCHVPRGNPDNAHTIRVGSRAVPAHMNHGDYEGECEEEVSSEGDDQSGDVESGEGEEDDEDAESGDPEAEKVLVCHIPRGNPSRAHTISVEASDVQDHLDHGDYEGECL